VADSLRRSEQLYNALHALKASPKTGHLIAEIRGLGVSAASCHVTSVIHGIDVHTLTSVPSS
jgi:hypothetical protein